MIGIGIRTLEYEEPLDANPPRCLREIAALLWAGFRLVPASREINFENVVVGKKRLTQFRDAKRLELTRFVRWHFDGRTIVWDGDPMRLDQWRELWRDNTILQHMVQATPAYDKWLAGLTDRVVKAPLVALAMEEGRACFGRVGGDAETLRDFHLMMEEGW